VLLRGVKPVDDLYKTGDMVDHAYHLLKNDAFELAAQTPEQNMILVFAKLGITEGHEDFRSCVVALYFENRRYAIDALREGITLDGEFQGQQWQIFP
jgi:hypothetical protein